MTERLILAGWGGQGMMLLGKILAEMGMREGLEVTFYPSYGAEVRGGTAHCHVVFSAGPIYSPIVEQADTLIIMNQPSYDKFHGRLKPDALMLLNRSLVAMPPSTGGDGREFARRIVGVPATDIANEVGDVRVANVVMLGVYNTLKELLPDERAFDALERALTGRKAALLDVNRQAYEKGRRFAEQLPVGA